MSLPQASYSATGQLKLEAARGRQRPAFFLKGQVGAARFSFLPLFVASTVIFCPFLFFWPLEARGGQLFFGNKFRWVLGVVPCPIFCVFLSQALLLFFLPFFVFLRSSLDSARCRRMPPDARGGQLFPLEQPAVHLAGWNPIQREGQDVFWFYRRPAGLLEASWPPKRKWPQTLRKHSEPPRNGRKTRFCSVAVGK